MNEENAPKTLVRSGKERGFRKFAAKLRTHQSTFQSKFTYNIFNDRRPSKMPGETLLISFFPSFLNQKIQQQNNIMHTSRCKLSHYLKPVISKIDKSLKYIVVVVLLAPYPLV